MADDIIVTSHPSPVSCVPLLPRVGVCEQGSTASRAYASEQAGYEMWCGAVDPQRHHLPLRARTVSPAICPPATLVSHAGQSTHLPRGVEAFNVGNRLSDALAAVLRERRIGSQQTCDVSTMVCARRRHSAVARPWQGRGEAVQGCFEAVVNRRSGSFARVSRAGPQCCMRARATPEHSAAFAGVPLTHGPRHGKGWSRVRVHLRRSCLAPRSVDDATP